MRYKPEGYISLSPYFIVADAPKFIHLLGELFGGKVVRQYDMPDGSIMHAEVQIDDSILMLGQAGEKWPATKQVVHLYVPDANALYAKALTLGCTSVSAPSVEEGDPDCRATFLDFAGNMWSVGTQQGG